MWSCRHLIRAHYVSLAKQKQSNPNGIEGLQRRMRSCCEVIFSALTLNPTVTPSFSNRQSVSRRNSLFEFKRFYSVVSLNHCKHLVSPPQPSLVKKSNDKYRTGGFSCACSTSAQCIGAERSDCEFVVVNFYHFVFIKDPEAEVAKHLSFLEVRSHFNSSLFECELVSLFLFEGKRNLCLKLY